MFHSFDINGKTCVGWGIPRAIENIDCNKKKIDCKLYSGEKINPNEKVLFTINGSSALGVGDSIWIMQYLRDIYKTKSNSRADMRFVCSDWINEFYAKFLPRSFNFKREYLLLGDLENMQHLLPAIYYWKGPDGADRGYVQNKSLIERLYNWTGMVYNGLGDWVDYTPDEILYPSKDSIIGSKNLPIKYCLFQWHSSGTCKNPTPEVNIRLIKHITTRHELPVIVVGRLTCLDSLQDIPNVINLSGKLEKNADALFSLAFGADLIVTPDSASLHLGEAYKVPTVGLMSTLPPQYIASKYQIPAFMFGGGYCPSMPCGVVHALPKATKCPAGTGDYCQVWNSIDLEWFDLCVIKTRENRANWRSVKAEDFNVAIRAPITCV